MRIDIHIRTDWSLLSAELHLISMDRSRRVGIYVGTASPRAHEPASPLSIVDLSAHIQMPATVSRVNDESERWKNTYRWRRIVHGGIMEALMFRWQSFPGDRAAHLFRGANIAMRSHHLPLIDDRIAHANISPRSRCSKSSSR